MGSVVNEEAHLLVPKAMEGGCKHHHQIVVCPGRKDAESTVEKDEELYEFHHIVEVTWLKQPLLAHLLLKNLNIFGGRSPTPEELFRKGRVVYLPHVEPW